jgi:4'-phosphopantetheinyl transferase EntD
MSSPTTPVVQETVRSAATDLVDLVLPPGIATMAVFDDPPHATLLAAEVEALGKVVEKRRREYTTVRHCARIALRKLGRPPTPLVPGLFGAPLWPPGVVGSMSHCEGYRVAAVASTDVMVTIGVDAEPNRPLPDRTLEVIADAEERLMLEELALRSTDACWDRVLFSAKESVYKAWFPLTQSWLGFDEAHLTIEPADGTFHARLLVPGPLVGADRLTGFSGRWTVSNGLVVTAIALPRHAPGTRLQ